MKSLMWLESLGVRLLVGLLTKELVRATYRGLLGRNPEPEALAVYARELGKKHDIAGILKAVDESPEHWKMLLGLKSEELVKAVFQGLLGRSPEQEALAVYAQELSEKHDLARILKAVDESSEHWERLLGLKSEELVNAAYKGILGQEPDAEAVAECANEVRRDRSLEPLLARLMRTEDAWKWQLSLRAETIVRAAYFGVLGRDADPSGLENYARSLRASGDLVPLFQKLAHSNEHRQKVHADYILLKRANTINAVENYVLIGIQSPAFLPYILATAELIHRNTGMNTVLISQTSSSLVFSAKLFSPAIIDVVSTKDFIANLGCCLKRPRYVLNHPFCGDSDFHRVIDLLPDIEVLLYADGPTGFLEDINNDYYRSLRPTGVVCFGYTQLHSTRGHPVSKRPLIACVPWSSVHDQYRRISETATRCLPAQPPVKATAMLFLRYWQAGRYNMPVQVVVHALTNLLAEHVVSGDVLVVKHDSRGDPGILASILNVARASGIAALSYDEYLKQWGYADIDPAAPFELFMDPLILAEVDRYLVLDSSMPITLPYALKYFGLRRQIKVVSGIRSSHFPGWVVEKNRGMVAEFAIHYRKTLSDLFPGDGLVIDQLEGERYWQASIDLARLDTTRVDEAYFDVERFQSPRDLVLVAVFLPGAEWLSFCLTLVHDLWESEGLPSLLVIPNDVKVDVPKYDGVFGKIELDDVDRAVRLGKLDVARVYVHSYGWVEDVLRLRHLFPNSPCGYYADGFKNEVKLPANRAQLAEITYFGFCPFDWPIPARILSFSDWRGALRAVMGPRRSEVMEIEADILVCLRYYGIGPYCIQFDEVLEVFWQSVQPVIKAGARILVKGDARSPTLLPATLAYFSERHDGDVEDLANVVGDLAAKPLECLLELNVLPKVSTYVVFDSSLSYILAHHPGRKNDAKIIVGAPIGAFRHVIPAAVGATSHEEQIAQEQGLAERSFEAAIKGIHFYTERYVNQLVREGFSTEKLSDALYLVDLAHPLTSKSLPRRENLLMPTNGE